MTLPQMSEDSWNEWRMHLSKELERLARNVDKLTDEVQSLKLAHNVLQTKVFLWGTVAAAAVTLIVQLASKVLN
jgi:hypothetical protein